MGKFKLFKDWQNAKRKEEKENINLNSQKHISDFTTPCLPDGLTTLGKSGKETIETKVLSNHCKTL